MEPSNTENLADVKFDPRNPRVIQKHDFEALKKSIKTFGDLSCIVRNLTTVWEFDKPSASKEHPTMKPIALVKYALTNSSKREALVLDTFGGSGSTLMACEEVDRTGYLMELDPKYVDVIRKRYAISQGREDDWEAFTPSVDN